MGPPDKQPPLPQYQWCMQPNAEQTTATKWMQDSNYAQALEGNIDSSHISFLHQTFDHPTIHHGAGAGRAADDGHARNGRSALCTARAAPRRKISTTGASPRTPCRRLPRSPSQSRAGNGIFVIPRDDETHWWITVDPPDQPDEPIACRTRR